MKIIKSIYNFIVGDMIILVGILLTICVLALIERLPALASLQAVSGIILVIAVLAVLLATLSREAFSKKRNETDSNASSL
jgi:membrane protein implicated in regulation of membrane protease activity